jgi:hypothetical protein
MVPGASRAVVDEGLMPRHGGEAARLEGHLHHRLNNTWLLLFLLTDHARNNSRTMTKAKRKNIVFFHPDLGIGGAERLVIDAAVGLQERGHKVTIFTSHCDRSHCFEEARDGKHLFYSSPLRARN